MPGADFDSVGRPLDIIFAIAEEQIVSVPNDRLYEVVAVAFVWNATANAGNRAIQVTLQNSNQSVVYQRQSRRVQVANESIRYVWAPGMPDETDVVPDNQLLQPMPLVQLGEGGRITINDEAAIDASDGLIGSVFVRIYKAS